MNSPWDFADFFSVCNLSTKYTDFLLSIAILDVCSNPAVRFHLVSKSPMLSLVTSLWLHSSLQGQQHEETKGIYLAFEHCKFKNIYTYLHYMIKVFYKILSSKVLRTVLELRKHMYSELSKTATMLQNLRCVTQIFITFLSHIRISGNLVRQ